MPEILNRLEAKHGRVRYIARFEPMEELISCILSQNSSDTSSFPAFTRLRERCPDWQMVLDMPVENLTDLIRKAGLANQKAAAIRGSLQILKETFGDFTLEPLRDMQLLEAREWLMRLPGVGPKTASIVLCFSFGRDLIPVDTHVHRVSKRLGIIPTGMDANKAHDALLDLVPPGNAFRFHVLFIQHGRRICTAGKPNCAVCPLTDLCDYYKEVYEPVGQ